MHITGRHLSNAGRSSTSSEAPATFPFLAQTGNADHARSQTLSTAREELSVIQQNETRRESSHQADEHNRKLVSRQHKTARSIIGSSYAVLTCDMLAKSASDLHLHAGTS